MASDPYAHHRATALGDVDDLTWYSTEPLGHYSSLGVISSGPVALIAGFVLATGAALATSDAAETLDRVALVVFSLAAGMLFVALLFVVEANALYSTPSDRLAWYPEAQVSEAVLDELRRRQRHDFARYYALRHRILALYPIGIALALAGLALVLVARADGRRLHVESADDAMADGLVWLAGLGLLLVAAYIVSFAELRVFRSLHQARDKRDLAQGLRLLGWSDTEPDGRGGLGKMALLVGYPPDPPAPGPP